MQHPVVVQDCFNHILRLKTHVPSQASAAFAADVHAVLAETLSSLLRQPDTFGLTLQDAHEVGYAIVALADESALGHCPAIAQRWQGDLLQARLFGENRAGEQFFVRLDALLGQGHARRTSILAYHTALGLGFVGRYVGQRGAASPLIRIRQAARDVLLEAGALIERQLAPEALVPLVASRQESRRVLRRFDGALGLFALALSVGVVVSALSLEARTDALKERTALALARLGVDNEGAP